MPFDIAEEMEKRLRDVDKDIKVAVMGCAVNGPGEAREADIGVAGGVGEGLIFKKGEPYKKVSAQNQKAILCYFSAIFALYL